MVTDKIDTDLLFECVLLAIKNYNIKVYVGDDNNDSQFINKNESAFNRTESELDDNVIQFSTNIINNDDARQFINECLRPPTQRPYEIPWDQKTLWAFLFGSMLLIAIIGNCIVIWIILAHREMRTITNYFLLNLSVVDLMMSSLNCIFNFIYMLNSDWPFGSFYCAVNNFMGNVTVATSVFTLVAISFDRYVAIVRPLHRRTSRKKARIFLIVIWSLSGIISLPYFIYSETESKAYMNGKTRTVCFVLWPDGRYPTSFADHAYNIAFLMLTYGIPMPIMVVCYTLMGKTLWGSQSIGEHTERQIESVKSKKKVVRMFIAVVAIFAVCWLPYHSFYVYAYHNPAITSSDFVPHLFLGFYWLAMSNSMVNPIIYYWMNRRFRHYFQEIMCFCCFQLWKAHSIHKSQDITLYQNSVSLERRSKSCRHRVDSTRSVRQYSDNTNSPRL